MAFRKKAEFILKEQPDILIIPECENIDKLIFKNDVKKPKDQFWFGQNPNKGIGIFTFSDLKIKLLNIHNPDFKYVLPLSIFNDEVEFIIFAIWAQKPQNHDCYTAQIWNAVHFYKELLNEENVILAGDFNSNSIWDKPNRIYNHSNLVDFLKNNNISSAYHSFYNQEQGKETFPTLFMHKKIHRPYHIDFCFVSKKLINKIKSVEVGKYEDWIRHSDHNPVIVTFEI